MSHDLFDVRDRVAVVTGGMGQLGATFAVALAHCGARVAVWDVATDLKSADERFDQEVASGSIKTFQVDLTRRDEVERAAEELAASWGVPHILVNNAALDSPPDAPPEEVGPFETYPETSYDQVMDVNVKGVLFCCQVVGGKMAEQGRGSIINISSIYGMLSPCQDIYEFRRQGGETFFKPVAYSISKSSLYNLTRYLATYWARKGVRVNTLTLAGIFNNQPEEFLEGYCARVPMGRMLNAGETRGALIFLASDASSYMTGADLVVDGGWTAW